MQTDYSDRISYLIVDTSQYAMAQRALNESHRLFPLANRIVFSDTPEGGIRQHSSRSQNH